MITPFVRRLVYDWCQRTFGLKVTNDKHDRALRIVEEAVELAQAEEVDLIDVIRLVNVVYERPVGDPKREIGGVMVTLIVFCEAMGYDLDRCSEMEIARILDTNPEVFRKRQAEKVKARLT